MHQQAEQQEEQRKSSAASTEQTGKGYNAPLAAPASASAQLKSVASAPAPQSPIQRQANNGGLPDQLRSGIESMSGMSMGDVRVHYNSQKPAQLQARAYAQGNNIHLGPGQEKHLPHEAWHVVQQKQGRVKPTMQLKKGVNVNDDSRLEKEADVMGAAAMRAGTATQSSSEGTPQNTSLIQRQANTQVLQPIWEVEDGKDYYPWHQVVEGLQWFLSSDRQRMWYLIRDDERYQHDAYIQANQGESKARTETVWLQDLQHWEQRQDDRSKDAPNTYANAVAGKQKPKLLGKAANERRYEFLRQLFAMKQSSVGLSTIRQVGLQSLEATAKSVDEPNMICNDFAAAFQGNLKTLKIPYKSLRFSFVPAPSRATPPREYSLIALNEPGHAFDNVAVGYLVHFGTLVVIDGERWVFDNHHPRGLPVDDYMRGLQFYVLEEREDKETGTRTTVMRSRTQLLDEGKVRVAFAPPTASHTQTVDAQAFYQDLAADPHRTYVPAKKASKEKKSKAPRSALAAKIARDRAAARKQKLKSKLKAEPKTGSGTPASAPSNTDDTDNATA